MTGLTVITTVFAALLIFINGVENSVRLIKLDVNKLLHGNRDLSSAEDLDVNRRPRLQDRRERQSLYDDVKRFQNNNHRNEYNELERFFDYNRPHRNQRREKKVNLYRNHNHGEHRYEQQQQHNQNALENILNQALNLDEQQNKRYRNQLRPSRLLGSNEEESSELDHYNYNSNAKNLNKYSKIYVLLNPTANNGNKNKLNEMVSYLLKSLKQDNHQKNYREQERYQARRSHRDDDGRDDQDVEHVRRPRNREYREAEGPAAGRTLVPFAGLRNNNIYARN